MPLLSAYDVVSVRRTVLWDCTGGYASLHGIRFRSEAVWNPHEIIRHNLIAGNDVIAGNNVIAGNQDAQTWDGFDEAMSATGRRRCSRRRPMRGSRSGCLYDGLDAVRSELTLD